MCEIGDRIKDPEAVILLPGQVLLEAVKKSGMTIMAPDENNPLSINYIKILKKAPDVTAYDIGDIVLDADNFQTVTFECKDRLFRKTLAMNLRLVVKASNFEKEPKPAKPNLLIN
jgi:hypothetical protein